jgi:hypothetical protein
MFYSCFCLDGGRVPVPQCGGGTSIPEGPQAAATPWTESLNHGRVLPQQGRLHLGGVRRVLSEEPTPEEVCVGCSSPVPPCCTATSLCWCAEYCRHPTKSISGLSCPEFGHPSPKRPFSFNCHSSGHYPSSDLLKHDVPENGFQNYKEL